MALTKIFSFLLMISVVFMDDSVTQAPAAQLEVPVPQQEVQQNEEFCSEPVNLQQRLDELYMGKGRGQMHETFYMLPFLREAAMNQTSRYNFSLEKMKRSQAFSGSSQCPKHHTHKAPLITDPCPVYYTLNTDSNRLPRVLLEAQCQCKQCQGIHKKRKTGCEGMFYFVRVLRRIPGCVDGVYQYAPAWERVQVGCACRLSSS